MSTNKRDIKMPAALVWREFRMRAMPGLVFLCAAVAGVYFWNRAVIGPTMVGEVESVQTPVRTAEAGILTNLLVHQFQLVKAGDPVAELIVTDLRSANSRLNDLRSRISLSQLEVNSILNRERWARDYQQLNMDMLKARADLSAARAQLPLLEEELKREEKLQKEDIVAIREYEAALRRRDSMKAWVVDLEKLVIGAENRLKEAAVTGGAYTNLPNGGSLAKALKQLDEDRIAMEGRRTSVVLHSPIDGIVGTIMHRPGENIAENDTILMVHALVGERILTYVRQGSTLPTKDAAVTVRCRSPRKEQAVAKIEEIGFHYETITNRALIRPGVPFEMGMPVAVRMPPTLQTILRPGELVDLTMP